MSRIILPGRGTLLSEPIPPEPPPHVDSDHTSFVELADLTDWTPFTLALTATTTDPTLGTGSVTQGRYMRFRDQIIYRFHIQFGSSGADAGSGLYRVSVPVDMASSNPSSNISMNGYGMLFDWSVAGHRQMLMTSRASATLLQLNVDNAQVSDNNPIPWTNDDRFGATVIYEAVPA